ncbi:extracellular solute-binding protein [Promicromonospora citrea]|uniref:ABC transporter substrate-binding protein n=1 Tax=Promicromonospora citrea TaxID=43677 RepID=UPI00361A6F5F
MTAALEEGGELLVWAWEPTLEQVVEDFEAAYPNVDVELANVGTGNDHYVVLQNAISAGSGVPDVAQVEYYALPQFSISGSLADLAPYGAAELDDTYSPGTWNAVTDGDAVYGLPMDSGPMALFYNARTFEEAGVEVPTTWTQFVEAARAIHAHDADTYILADNGDAGFTTSMIWQAGGHPFRVDGTAVTVDLTDDGVTRFAQLWQQLLDDDLVADIPQWSDEWFQRLGDGTIAALVTGAWMPANLESGAAQAAGGLARGAHAAVDRGRERDGGERRLLARRDRGERHEGVGLRVRAVRQRGRRRAHPPGPGQLPPPRRRTSRAPSSWPRSPSTSAGSGSTRCSRPRRPGSSRAGSTCPTRCTPTACTRTPSARPTPARRRSRSGCWPGSRR